MIESRNNIVELDVREQLRNKQEPFQLIMGAVSTLKEDDIFVLHATFNPTPLLKVMESKGYENEVKQIEEDHFIVTFTRKVG